MLLGLTATLNNSLGQTLNLPGKLICFLSKQIDQYLVVNYFNS